MRTGRIKRDSRAPDSTQSQLAELAFFTGEYFDYR
jgi:hypothetical protein